MTEKDTKIIRVSPKTANDITPQRKAALEQEINSGMIKEGKSLTGSVLVRGATAPAPVSGNEIARGTWVTGVPGGSRGNVSGGVSKSAVGAVAHSSSFIKNKSSMIKEGSDGFSSSSGGSGTTQGGSMERLAPEVYSPLFTMANLNLPRDRITVNAWVRNFFQLHPIVRNAITLHATYPISKLNLKCHDKKVLQFHEDMIENMNMMESLGDIALEYWKIGECVRNNSLIFTKQGIKKIVDIQIGDEVLTHSGKYQIVKEKLINWDNNEILSIQTRGMSIPIELSKNHPMYIIKTSLIKNRLLKKSIIIDDIIMPKNIDKWEMEWEKAENVKVGDMVVIPVNREIKDSKNLTKKWCRMFGLWLAEGCFNRNKGETIKVAILSNFDEKVWEYYEPIVDSCGLKLTSTGENRYIRSKKVRSNFSEKAAKLINKHGNEYSLTKKMSEEILLLPPEKQLEIVKGFIDGDGWIHRGRICMGTISVDLALQIRQILARNYITCSINISKRQKQGINDLYSIEIPLFYAHKFNLYPTKQESLNEEKENRPLAPNNIPRQRFTKEGHLLAPIIKINHKSLEKGEPLYNLEVENDNSYCVQGIAVHNCFPYAELDNTSGKWSKIVIQNPDFILVKKTVLSGEPVISLKPDQVLKRLVMSSSPADVQLRKQIPEKIIYHIRNGQDIPLDNFNVSHLKMLASPYDVRGTSIIVSAFKDLMLYDKIRECKFAQADGMINPMTIIKVGGNADGEYRATQEDIEYFRQLFEEGQYDHDFKVITHAGVTVERIGFQGQVLEIASDMELIIKNIYIALMVPPAVVDTESAVYSSASIGLEILRQRYFNYRNMIASWLTRKIFAPISEIQDFYEYRDGVKKLIVPEVEWNKMNLYDLQDYIGNITGLVSQKQVSLQTLYKSLGLNYQDEIVKMRQEAIKDAIRIKEEENLRKMSVIELKALDPEKEIVEPIDSKEREVAGQPPESGGGIGGGIGGMPGADMGMGGMGGGALPGGMPGGMELAPPPAAPPIPSGSLPGAGPAPGPKGPGM